MLGDPLAANVSTTISSNLSMSPTSWRRVVSARISTLKTISKSLGRRVSMHGVHAAAAAGIVEQVLEEMHDLGAAVGASAATRGGEKSSTARTRRRFPQWSPYVLEPHQRGVPVPDVLAGEEPQRGVVRGEALLGGGVGRHEESPGAGSQAAPPCRGPPR
ncbi:hypothetical protein E2562_020868 [Oryza meyeriana var. granulata]|uniref:Uncharacterized protein n=1 Tax=Oryza meyeriana var. granulata TaxID=110450 RepID=A0A6G1D6K9_9ORYZ|nr:hypothetical protein E2562_020868 [Oryza meyeriana var. granulata]